MVRLAVAVVVLLLCAGTAHAQVFGIPPVPLGAVQQGASGADPWKVVFGSPQAVTQSGGWSISFIAPQHVICDSGCAAGAPGQTTMAASSPVAIASDQSAVPVSGTFWQTTQPVSVASIPSHAVTNAGTFAVQAVLGAETTKVIGTVNLAAGQVTTLTPPTNTGYALDASLSTLNTSVNTLLKPASTLAAVTTVGTITNAVAITSADLDVALSTRLKPADTLTAVTTVGTITNPVTTNDTPPSLTKATQGSTGYSTQDLKDAGRTALSFYANNFASGTTTTETIITWTQSSGTGAVTASTASYTITNGKRLRIQAIQVASRGNATATVQSTVFNLRLNTAGACTVTSTPILFAAQSATAAVASAWDRVTIPIPDGYEIAGNGTISICMSAAATFTTNAPTWAVNLVGYEY